MQEVGPVGQCVFTHVLLCCIGNDFFWLVATLRKLHGIGLRKKHNATIYSQYGDCVHLLFLLVWNQKSQGRFQGVKSLPSVKLAKTDSIIKTVTFCEHPTGGTAVHCGSGQPWQP